MWTNDGINLYFGDCRQGDREATDAEIAEWESSRTKTARKAEILVQLQDIDAKSVRPLAEGDMAYLATLRAPVAALRAELKTL